MRIPFAIRNLKSNYCKAVFVVSLFLGYIITPKSVFTGHNSVPAFIFIFLLSLTTTCIVRNIKEKIKNGIKVKKSLLSVLSGAIGLTALQVCGMSGVMCGASASAGLLSIILPGAAFNLFENYSTAILWSSILIQLLGLYFLKCLDLKESDHSNKLI